MSLRVPIHTKLRHGFASIDVRLNNGTVFQNIAVDESGVMLGRVVGGQDGVDPSPLPFKQEDWDVQNMLNRLVRGVPQFIK